MSIASRITSIEGHISDIYDSVELTGVDTTDIDKNLVNVPNTLKEGYIDIINNGTDTLYNNFPKVSGEGTSLILNNTYQAPMRNLPKGNTSQTGTPTPTSPIHVNVVSGDNSVVVCGKNLFEENKYLTETFTTGTYKYALTNIRYTNKDLYVGARVKEGKTAISGLYVAFTTVGSNPNSGISKFALTNGNVLFGKYTLQENVPVYISYYPTSYTWQQILEVYDIWVTYEENLTTYELYNGDTYNIDLPEGMELCKIGNYQDQFKKATGKNLAPINLESETYNTLQITNNNNGTFTLYGNPTGSFGRDIATNLTLKAGTYTISANAMPSGLYIALDNEADTQLSNGTLSKTFTLASDTTYTSLGIWFTKNKDYDVTIKLQIEKSSSATEWQPMNGWYLHKEIGKYTFSDLTTWSKGSSAPTGSVQFYTSKPTNFFVETGTQALNKIINNRFISQDTVNGMRIGGSISFFPTTDLNINDTDTWKTWTLTNILNIYYVLATPTNEPIPTNLINQLEELYIAKSKENQTNISQINNDLPFIVSASALKKGV